MLFPTKPMVSSPPDQILLLETQRNQKMAGVTTESTTAGQAESLFATACAESIFLQGTSGALQHLYADQILDDRQTRDEAGHIRFAMFLFERTNKEPDAAVAADILEAATRIEKEFAEEHRRRSAEENPPPRFRTR